MAIKLTNRQTGLHAIAKISRGKFTLKIGKPGRYVTTVHQSRDAQELKATQIEAIAELAAMGYEIEAG